jgi:prolyl oligopeptidase
MKNIILAASMAAALCVTGAAMAEDADPFQWLEDVEGEKPLAWVKAQNERSLKILQADSRFAEFEGKALAILQAQDRIAAPSFRAGKISNFWQDKVNVRGIARRTTIESYLTDNPSWETVIDVDALSKAENANWVFKGSNCLQPEETRCLVSLSEGGKDAVEIREFDSVSKSFVEGGFRLSSGKQGADWLDADTLFVARDWGPGTMTESGYAYIVKKWKRGTPLESAVEVFRGTQKDVAANAGIWRDADGKVQAIIYSRYTTFFESEHSIATDKGNLKLPLPPKATLQTLVDGQLVISLEDDWTWGGKKYGKGTLLSFSLDELKKDPQTAKATLVFSPGPRESVEQVSSTRNRLVVAVYENVKGGLYAFSFKGKAWQKTKLNLPANASIGVVSTRNEDDRAFVNVTGFIDPDSLYLGDVTKNDFKRVKSLPPRFDGSNIAVEQHEATSPDGTKVPYFILHRKDMKLDGKNPTLLYAYGGFQVSMTPSYSGNIGKLWLERGGVYVLANIRGGGEFGPSWHQAGLKTSLR